MCGNCVVYEMLFKLILFMNDLFDFGDMVVELVGDFSGGEMGML